VFDSNGDELSDERAELDALTSDEPLGEDLAVLLKLGCGDELKVALTDPDTVAEGDED
jgi:hypothetical protein